ncbi:4-hydroxybenzoyl-CoA thioesterase family active site [Hydrogenimonas sp.]|nr:4-hydroxybenzoyl-CoA thioesterase family active site [Hydrogenimonas sp.]
MKIRVYYEDTDAAGIVYYANYLKFCERARSEAFFRRGLTPQSEEGYFVVKRVEADYIMPAKLGDVLDVETELLEKRGASITLLQSLLKDGETLFKMVVKLAFLKEGRPARIPSGLHSIISEW